MGEIRRPRMEWNRLTGLPTFLKLNDGREVETRRQFLGAFNVINDEQREYRLMLRDVVLRGDPWCLMAYGKKGNGKTLLAQIAVNTFNDGGYKGGIYTTQPLMQVELRSDGNTAYRRYVTAGVLVIDELSDRPSDWTEFIKTNIENILIERHRMNLPVVMIGNIKATRIEQMFDERVMDRIKEGLFMNMKEESMRRLHDGNK